MKKHLIIYVKRPLAGYAKTRLGSAIGLEASAGVYARVLFNYVLDVTYKTRSRYHIELSVTSPEDMDFFKFAFPELTIRTQTEGDLGVRMKTSFQQAFEDGAEYAVLTGSDIPGLNSDIIDQAFKLLEGSQGVIGPATDGGYYLIGLQAPGYSVFTDIAWSTKNVLTKTLKQAEELGISLIQLPVLADMDDQAAYENWKNKIKTN